jgi:hypothetical protein
VHERHAAERDVGAVALAPAHGEAAGQPVAVDDRLVDRRRRGR